MKKEKRKSISWLMGGVVALTFLGSGSLAAAQTVTSYNDLAWGTGQLETNITKITSPNGGSVQPFTGQLVDFGTGNPTAVTLTVTGGLFDGDPSATQGADPTTGDAVDIFAGKVNGLGVLSYINMAGSDLVLTFTNMGPNKVYDLTFFAHRDNYAWDRASLVTISGQDAFVNTSSIATDNPDTGTYPGGVLFTGPTSPSTRLPADNDNGYVARFSNIKSGSDGTVVLTISFDGNMASQFLGKYGGALRLIESGGTSNDVDGDGKADIVWRHKGNGAVAVWLMDGLTMGPFGIPGGAPTTWIIKGIGDLDGDGKADLVWRNTSTGEVEGWLMDGFGAPTMRVISGPVSAKWEIAGVGDLNGDGKADLVWRNTTDGSVAGWLMNGLSTPTQGNMLVISGPVAAAWAIEGVGDLDGNNTADIIWRHTITGAVAVWFMNGLSAPIMSMIGGVVSLEWEIEGVGDLDDDEKADLVWRHTGNGSVGVWLMNGASITSTAVLGGVSSNWEIKQVADVNGDGKADLVWRNTDNGDVGVWLMDGVNAPTTMGVVKSSVSLEWEIQP